MWVTIPTPEQIAHPDNCKGCNAPILWVRNKVGTAVPINTDYKVKDTFNLGVEMMEIKNSYSHFATCPEAGSFRRKKRA